MCPVINNLLIPRFAQSADSALIANLVCVLCAVAPSLARRLSFKSKNKKIYQNVNAGASAFQENMEALKHNFFLRGFLGSGDSWCMKQQARTMIISILR